MEKITSVVWAACSSSLAAVAFASPTLSSGLEELKRRVRGIEPRQGNIRPSTVSRIAILFAIAFTFAMPLCSPLLAVVDDHNPIGVTGAFEGVTTTAGAYNVLSHNATRQIDDIVVPGAIGKYGLKVTRYYNSRRNSNSGIGPGWMLEYVWGKSNINFGTQYRYPNGNVWDSSCTDTWNNQPGPLGVSDWPTTWNGYPAFRLADGGTVVFENSSFATKVIDPYGQITYITVDGSGQVTQVMEPGGRYLTFLYGTVNGFTNLREVDAYDGQGHLIDYVVYNYTAIKPEGNGTQGTAVNCLTSVDYSDGTHAYYAYQDDNVPDNPPPCPCSIKIYPLVRTCQDVRYKGPMRNICYDYVDNGAHGAITAERYSVSGSTNGVQVSKIDQPPPPPDQQSAVFPTTFIETRADGPSRTFNYTSLHLGRTETGETCAIWNKTVDPAPQQFLQSYTDFSTPAHTTNLYYDGNWYVNSVKDANGNSTTYTRGPPPPAGIGQITDITYPSNTGTVHYDYQPETGAIPGHYLASITTARPAPSSAEITVYTRDSSHRITETDYKEGSTVLATETFTYCDQPDVQQCSLNPRGQIKTQKLKNGAYVHYQYDGLGNLLAKTEPTWTADGPTALGTALKTTYTYYGIENSYTVTIPWNYRQVTVYPWADRLKTMTLAPNTNGLQASDTYEYDRVLDSYPNGITNLAGAARPGRGLVTKITHTEQAPNPNTYQQFKYDAYGNKRWEDNELRNATSYTYDDYSRPLNVTRPLNEITNYTYNTNGANSSYQHTTNSPDKVSVRTSATTTLDTNNVYDENFRKTSSIVSGRTAWFGYDNVGNQTYVTDPRGVVREDSGYTTHTDYDVRNRKTALREPLGRTTQFYYDDNINVTRIVRPDGTTETKVYDGMNRLTSDTVPKDTGISILTQFQYYPSTGDPTDSGHSASLLSKVIDGNTNSYQFKYDAAGMKTKMIYPDNVSSQQWAYDNVHNLMNRTAVGSEVQSFNYDIRNRKISMSWSNSADSASFTYYADSRLATASNPNSVVTRQYDNAGRLLYDQQNVIGLGTKTVNYAYYDDASPKETSSVGTGYNYDFTFLYDDMRRLQTIQATAGPTNLFQYTYDNASNEIERDTVFNGVSQISPRDALNRMMTLTVLMGNWTASEAYDYWPSGRLHTVTHEYSLQDQFDYFLDGELKSASYNVGSTPTPSPTPTPTATPRPGQVAEPTFDPPGGNIYPDTVVSVTITSATSGAQIKYSTDDGSTWTPMSNGQHTRAFEPGIQQTQLIAIATKTGMEDSIPHHDYYWRQDPRGSPKLPGTLSRTVTYTLDNAGNRGSVLDSGNGTWTYYTPNNLNQYSLVGNYPVTNGTEHQISSYQGLNYTYINDEHLISVSAGYGFSYQLAYDALGRCVKRTVSGAGPSVASYYVYDGEKPILEFDDTSGHALVAYNIYGKGVDEILERAYLTGGQWQAYCFQQDYEGSVTHLTDPSTGNMLELYRYDAFGAPSIWGPPEHDPPFPQLSASAYGNRFMFTGREYNAYGFYEYRARAYHPSLGRFTSEDPKLSDAGDYNLFRYCHNDPIDMTDPMGTDDQNHTGQAPRELSRTLADDNSYNFIMALMQRQFTSAISAGMVGYAYSQAWSALQATQVSYIAQAKGTAEASNGHLTSVGDKQVFSALRNKYDEVSAAHLDKMSIPAFWRFQRDNNTAPEEFYNPKMYQYSGALTTLQHYHNGIYSGHDMNYMAIGEGFAARGLSTEKMATAIIGWRYGILGPSNALRGRPFGGLTGGEYPWALVGYYYYQGRSAGMGY